MLGRFAPLQNVNSRLGKRPDTKIGVPEPVCVVYEKLHECGVGMADLHRFALDSYRSSALSPRTL
jgi:hypothetical protein